MAACYGASRWEREYGANPDPTWVASLAHFTLDDLARGIVKAERDTSAFLPTLGAVRSWCREFQPGTFVGASRPPPPLPALEHLVSNSETGKRWLAVARGKVDDPAMRAAVERETHRLRGRMGL